MSESSGARILRSLPGIPSGPVALCSLMFWRSFKTPCLLTRMVFICFASDLEGCLFEFCEGEELGSGLEKTLQNCRLKMSALVLRSVTQEFSWNKSDVSDFSFLIFPMYVQNFLLQPLEGVKRSETYSSCDFLHCFWTNFLQALNFCHA